MRITRIKVNGIETPIGFALRPPCISWNVEDAKGTHAEAVDITVSEDPEFQTVCCKLSDRGLSCTGTELPMKLKPRTRYYVRITIRDETGDTGTGMTWFETGKMDEPWKGQWIGMEKDDAFHPVFHKTILPYAPVACARLYICGLGAYEAYIDGVKIGREYLTPDLNDYTSALQVQTYDVTEAFHRDAEEHALDVCLGNGWYKGIYGESVYGDRFALICELHLKDQDGFETVIGTDSSWRYKGYDVEDDGIYTGEIFNRLLWKEKENPWKQVRAGMTPEETGPLTDRVSLPVVRKEILPVKEVIHTPAGETVLDMGQNFSGWLVFQNRLPAGSKVHLAFGEVLQNGNFCNSNYRTATGGYTYVSNGDEELVRPHFTFFGFRYVKVTGWAGDIHPDDFEGWVLYSDLERTGFFESGNEKINRLYLNSLWGQKSNFLDIPTDCPQRDERLGWTGDAQVFSRTASYHMDTRAFYRKYLWDMRHEQVKYQGGVPGYIPKTKKGPFGSIAAIWGDAATFIPEVLWQDYGDPADLSVHWNLMKDWVDYISAQVERVHGTVCALWDFDFQFGDWLALDGPDGQAVKGATSDDFLATAYYFRSAELVAKAADILGFEEEKKYYAKLAGDLKTLILDHYVTPFGHLCVTTQTGYITALKFGLYRDQAVMIRDFMSLLLSDGHSIRCGFAGAPVICQVLADCGQIDEAYRLLLKETYPGWLYEVNMGATTIWERWNSILPDGNLSGTGMNSLNHYSYGSVVEFLYAYSAGLRPSEPGFRKAVIAPNPHGKLKECHLRYVSNAGTYIVNWDIRPDGKLNVHIEVPFGCQARIHLPADHRAPFVVGAGKYDFAYQPEVNFLQKFTENSTIGELCEDEEAKALLLKMIPTAQVMMGNDMAAQLFMLRQMGMLGITDDMCDAFFAELSKMTYQ